MIKRTVQGLVIILTVGVPLSSMAALEPGTVVIYSDGNVEKLLQRSSEGTLWENQRKRQYKRSYLPYLPVLGYQRFSEKPSGYEQWVNNMENIKLIPFGKQDSVRFTATRNDQVKGRSSRNWKCIYEGAGDYKLSGTRYETEKYRCQRYKINKYGAQQVKEQIRYQYAPELDLVLQSVRTKATGKTQRTEVSRILAPERASAKRIARTVYKQRTAR